MANMRVGATTPGGWPAIARTRVYSRSFTGALPRTTHLGVSEEMRRISWPAAGRILGVVAASPASRSLPLDEAGQWRRVLLRTLEIMAVG